MLKIADLTIPDTFHNRRVKIMHDLIAALAYPDENALFITKIERAHDAPDGLALFIGFGGPNSSVSNHGVYFTIDATDNDF